MVEKGEIQKEVHVTYKCIEYSLYIKSFIFKCIFLLLFFRVEMLIWYLCIKETVR